MILVANVFSKVEIVKKFDRILSNKRRVKKRFDSQLFKASQILSESAWDHFYHVFSSFWAKLIWKMSPLVIGEILVVFVDALTAEGKYPVKDWENLPLPVQMQLSDN